MGVHNFVELKCHIGHRIVCVSYGKKEIVNVSIECETCNEVLLDFDKYKWGEVNDNIYSKNKERQV